MNFKKLQQMQAELDAAILAEKATMAAEERFEKTLVALSVEIAEVANTAEHFKFWKDNKGKVDNDRFYCIPQTVREGKAVVPKYVDLESNRPAALSFEQAHKLTLVEEASDCLHFILSLANQSNYAITEIGKRFHVQEDTDSMETNYLFLTTAIGSVDYLPLDFDLELIIDTFFIYVQQLGITDEELEQAYYDKNEINYERLANGY